MEMCNTVAHPLMLTTASETLCCIIAIQRIARITHNHRQGSKDYTTKIQHQNARNANARDNLRKHIPALKQTNAKHVAKQTRAINVAKRMKREN